ncbi:Rpa49 subunit specific to nuclear RNA polymerase I [Cylindrobasidium torrendii FP15055 ss-10]|uniref:Rpa49 subunit specific to nuclear RNA polymerase I n=1 Tax=Cylindrobasidium torrendii FP15055 ss-10 TaxID=1314674 RepID=A0A0D7B4R4_9AGAR|nr:Rpa49 subunit specific to nuclear RNA polymerase I [Cylindrobasidium torrendii FP15055 ss-10]
MAKRKREASPERTTIAASDVSYTPGQNVPVLLSFPAIQPTAETPFKCYAHKKSRKDKEANESVPTAVGVTVAAETEDMEFVTNADETKEVEGAGCKYMIAVHNKRTGATELLPMTVPVHIVKQNVKALKSAMVDTEKPGGGYQVAKTALGESFGTKKAKASIRAAERNKVDVAAMQGAMDHVMDGIEKGAGGLPSKDEAKAEANANRLVPPYDEHAVEPADIYPLQNIVPENEWKAISISALERAEDFKARLALLPERRSEWVNGHLRKTQGMSPKNIKKTLKFAYYVSTMIAFRRFAGRRECNLDTLQEQLKTVPDTIVEGMYLRFTEASRGSSDRTFTSGCQTKLLTYMFALCLKADGFASDPPTLSNDLGLPVSQVQQTFKSLGCTLKSLSENERAKLGLSNTKSTTKMAVLTAPVTFPNPPRRQGKK